MDKTTQERIEYIDGPVDFFNFKPAIMAALGNSKLAKELAQIENVNTFYGYKEAILKEVASADDKLHKKNKESE